MMNKKGGSGIQDFVTSHSLKIRRATRNRGAITSVLPLIRPTTKRLSNNPAHAMRSSSWVENRAGRALLWIAADCFMARLLSAHAWALSGIVLWESTLSFYWIWHLCLRR